MRIAVNVAHLSHEMMSFFGFNMVWEEYGFKVFRDSYQEDHIVRSDYPFIFVDNEFDADAMKSREIIRF